MGLCVASRFFLLFLLLGIGRSVGWLFSFLQFDQNEARAHVLCCSQIRMACAIHIFSNNTIIRKCTSNETIIIVRSSSLDIECVCVSRFILSFTESVCQSHHTDSVNASIFTMTSILSCSQQSNVETQETLWITKYFHFNFAHLCCAAFLSSFFFETIMTCAGNPTITIQWKRSIWTCSGVFDAFQLKWH